MCTRNTHHSLATFSPRTYKLSNILLGYVVLGLPRWRYSDLALSRGVGHVIRPDSPKWSKYSPSGIDEDCWLFMARYHYYDSWETHLWSFGYEPSRILAIKRDCFSATYGTTTFSRKSLMWRQLRGCHPQKQEGSVLDEDPSQNNRNRPVPAVTLHHTCFTKSPPLRRHLPSGLFRRARLWAIISPLFHW